MQTTVTIKKSGNKTKSVSYIVALPPAIVESWGIKASDNLTKEERQINIDYDNKNDALILSPLKK